MRRHFKGGRARVARGWGGNGSITSCAPIPLDDTAVPAPLSYLDRCRLVEATDPPEYTSSERPYIID
jgi:hypothetical protein